MKLIKLSADHYIIMDDYGVDIYSTQTVDNTDIQPLSLSEVKELLGEVDVEKKAEKKYPIIMRTKTKIGGGTYDTDVNFSDRYSYMQGYNQALKDNKDRVYTEEDMRKMFALTLENAPSTESHTRMISDREYRHFVMDTLYNRLILRSQPKTQWDVQFVDGKLKLI